MPPSACDPCVCPCVCVCLRTQVLRVRSTVANSHASQVLKSGDMVLAISNRPVTCFRDVEAIISEHNPQKLTNQLLTATQAVATENGGSPFKRAGGDKTPQSASKKRKVGPLCVCVCVCACLRVCGPLHANAGSTYPCTAPPVPACAFVHG